MNLFHIDSEKLFCKNREREDWVHCTSRGEVLVQMCELGGGPWIFGNVVLMRSSFLIGKQQAEQSIPKKGSEDAKRCAVHQYIYATYIYILYICVYTHTVIMHQCTYIYIYKYIYAAICCVYTDRILNSYALYRMTVLCTCCKPLQAAFALPKSECPCETAHLCLSFSGPPNSQTSFQRQMFT